MRKEMSEKDVVWGVIGGSGMYDLPGLEIQKVHQLNTFRRFFSFPSSDIVEGVIHGQKIFFLSRHGKGHYFLPSEIPYCGNIFALKELGVTHLVLVTAVGSLSEEIRPGEQCIPIQIIDNTWGRQSSFFGNGVAGHLPAADPFCNPLVQWCQTSLSEYFSEYSDKDALTLLTIQGPRFSTRAESCMFRSWGAHIIGMTTAQEAFLAAEAGIHCVAFAQVTDYDCWKSDVGDVTADEVGLVMERNIDRVRKTLSSLFERTPELRFDCVCGKRMSGAIMTNTETLRESQPRTGGRLGNHDNKMFILKTICGGILPK